MVVARPILREFAQGLQRTQKLFDHWEQHAPATLKSAISAHGLIVPISRMSFPDLFGLLAVHRDRGDAGVVQRVRELYEEVFGVVGLLDDLEASWAAHPLLRRRQAILQQALRAHSLGMFAVSVPALIAQFEGLVADAASHRGQMNGPAMRARVAALTADASVAGAMFASFVGDALLAHFEHGAVVPPFSRHAILHGGDVEYATELNSRTAILLIDNMRELTEADEAGA
jgi:hypothetical protein